MEKKQKETGHHCPSFVKSISYNFYFAHAHTISNGFGVLANAI